MAEAAPLKRLLHQVPCVLWATDRNLVLTHILGAIPRLGELRDRFVVGGSIYELCGTRDPAHPMLAPHLSALAGRSECMRQQFGNRWFEASLEPLYDDNEIIGCIGAAFDVTERRVAEQRLEESEARLAEAQRIAHVGSFVWDVEQNTLVWSDEMYRIYGIDAADFGGDFESFIAHIPPDEIDRTKSQLFSALHATGSSCFDHSIIRADGALRILHTCAEATRDDRNHPVRLAGSCWDVTELRQTTSALEQSVSLLRATLDATADGILVVDRSGKVTACNQRFRDLWRIPPKLADKGMDEALLDYVQSQLEDPKSFLSEVRELYAQPELESFEVLRFKDGRAFERYSRPQRVGDEVIGRVWSFRDVTDRERLLRRAELLADASRLLTSLDLEKGLQGVARLAVPVLGNRCAVDLLGNGEPRRVLSYGRDTEDPMSIDLHPAVLAGNSITYSVGSTSYLQVPITAKGSLLGAMTLISAPNRQYQSFEIDLAEELGTRAALAIENARYYQGTQLALRAREEFLSVAAHEIRGPLTSIHLAAQKLADGSGGASAKHFAAMIIREDRRLGRFVDELLDLGRIQTGQLRFDMEEVNLAHVVHEVMVRLAPDISASGSSIALELDEKAIGEWDRFRIEQVITNLLSNAIKFGLGKPIRVAVHRTDDAASLLVSDRGIGIDPEMRDRIFKPFERQASIRHYGGLGLGLYIVRTIVEGLGGRVHVESQQGQGATFTVELPRKRPP